MAIITQLKLVAASRATRLSDTERRRLKLADKIDDQLKCAEAAKTNSLHTKSRSVWRMNDEGENVQVTISRNIRPWWWKDIKGQIYLAIKYGSQPLELAKGKAAIQIGNLDELSKTLDSIKQAVLAGELDAQLEQAGLKTASKFKN
jgi:hypothetical protein